MINGIWKLFCLLLISFLITLIGLFFFAFPHSVKKRSQLLLIQFWSRLMCRLFNLKIKLSGEALPEEGGYLVVANHTSYFDIAAVGSLLPTSFVSKASVAWWPIIGWGMLVSGIILLKRSSLKSRRQLRDSVVDYLKQGLNVCLYPEGTTGDGQKLLPFRGGSFKIAMQANAPVLPITIAYDDPQALKWVDDMSFVGHLLGLCKKRIGLSIHVGKPLIPNKFSNSQQFAKAAMQDIGNQLKKLIHRRDKKIRAIDWSKFILQENADDQQLKDFCRRSLKLLLEIDSSTIIGEDQVCNVVSKILAANKLSSKTIKSSNGHSNLHCYYEDPQKEAIVLLANSDVVPADEEKWQLDPFEGIELDGTIHGRGALDMKGQLATFLALYILAAKAKKKSVPLQLLLLADEEKGGHGGSQFFCNNLLKGINPQLILGEGGFGIKDYQGVPAPLFLISSAEKGSLWLKLTAKKETMAHSSAPPAESAATMLFKSIAKIKELCQDFEVCQETEEFIKTAGQKSQFFASIMPQIYNIPLLGPKILSSIEEDPYLRAMFHNTVALTKIKGGLAENIIPQEISATLDIRLHLNNTAEEFIKRLKEKIADKRVNIEIIHQSPASSSDFKSKDFQQLKEAILAIYKDAVVSPFLLPGSTDLTYFRHKKIKNCFGIFPAALSWQQLASIHGVDENISIEQLFKAFSVYRHFLQLKGAL